MPFCIRSWSKATPALGSSSVAFWVSAPVWGGGASPEPVPPQPIWAMVQSKVRMTLAAVFIAMDLFIKTTDLTGLVQCDCFYELSWIRLQSHLAQHDNPIPARRCLARPWVDWILRHVRKHAAAFSLSPRIGAAVPSLNNIAGVSGVNALADSKCIRADSASLINGKG